MAFEVTLVRTWDDMREALSVRRSVFIEEQAVDEAIEIDEHDRDPAEVLAAIHVLGRLDGRAIATGRLVLDDTHPGYVHAGRVAVLAEFRGHGYGREIMEALHALARERGYAGVTLSAQLHALGFYESLGYQPHGDIFIEADIEHRWMDLPFGERT